MPFSTRLTKEQIVLNSWVKHFPEQENIEILRNLRYSLDIELSKDAESDRRLDLTSIASLTISREWLPKDQSFRNHAWVYNATRTPLLKKHFEPVKLRFHDEDKSHSLLWLSLLALKTAFDSLTHRKADGLLFRSEVYTLRQLGLWDGIERDVNKIASNIGGETRRPQLKAVRYPFLPLRDKFLWSRNEIFGILCWQGNTKGNASTGVYGEAVGALNVAACDIRVFAPSKTLLVSSLLRDTLVHLFPAEMLLTEERMSAIEYLIAHDKTPMFRLSDLPRRADSKVEDVEKLIARWRGARKFTKRRPSGLQIFDAVFAKHPATTFVGRRTLFGAIDRFVLSPTVDSRFLVIIGESGIGKTALMANYLRDKQMQHCHYFVESKKQDIDDPAKILRHILLFLTAKYNLSPVHSNDSLPKIADRLNARVAEISQSQLSEGEREIIFVDAVDEIRDDFETNMSGVSWLRLNLPSNFGLVLTASRISGLEHFIAPDKSNCIVLSGADLENSSDLRRYVGSQFGEDMSTASSHLSEMCAGNFLCAKMLLDLLSKRQLSWNTLEQHLIIGLDHVYDLKLDLIASRLKNARRIAETWDVMRLISLLERPHTRSEICEILNIDVHRARSVFGPIERFLDLSEYGQQRNCRYFHKSLEAYLKQPQNLPKSKFAALNRRLARYFARSPREITQRHMMVSLWSEICHYYSRASSPAEFVKYLRRNLFREINSSDWYSSLGSFIPFDGVKAAREAASRSDLVFFGLLYASLDDASVSRQRRVKGRDSESFHRPIENQNEAKQMAAQLAPGVAQVYLEMKTDWYEFKECFINYYDVISPDLLGNPSAEQTYELCDYYARLWDRPTKLLHHSE